LAQGESGGYSFYIDSNIHHIATILLHIYADDSLEQHTRNSIRKDIQWIVSVYWRMYDYQKEIKGTNYLAVLDHLLFLAFHFNQLEWSEEVKEIVSVIVSIAKSFFEKSKDQYGFDPIRILERAAYVCILSGRQDVVDDFVQNVKVGFWDKYKEKFPEHTRLLSSELLDIDPVDLRLNSSKLKFEDELLASFTREQIEEFVRRIEPLLS